MIPLPGGLLPSDWRNHDGCTQARELCCVCMRTSGALPAAPWPSCRWRRCNEIPARRAGTVWGPSWPSLLWPTQWRILRRMPTALPPRLTSFPGPSPHLLQHSERPFSVQGRAEQQSSSHACTDIELLLSMSVICRRMSAARLTRSSVLSQGNAPPLCVPKSQQRYCDYGSMHTWQISAGSNSSNAPGSSTSPGR